MCLARLPLSCAVPQTPAGLTFTIFISPVQNAIKPVHRAVEPANRVPQESPNTTTTTTTTTHEPPSVKARPKSNELLNLGLACPQNQGVGLRRRAPRASTGPTTHICGTP